MSDTEWQQLHGSDSLEEIELLMAIEAALGREVELDPSLSATERTRVIRELAARLGRDGDNDNDPPGSPVRQRGGPPGSGPTSGSASDARRLE